MCPLAMVAMKAPHTRVRLSLHSAVDVVVGECSNDQMNWIAHREPTLTVAANVTDLPAPTSFADGLALDPIRVGQVIESLSEHTIALPEQMILTIRTDVGAGVTLPGPVFLYAGSNGAFDRLPQALNGGVAINVTPSKGYPARLFLPGPTERIAISSNGPLVGGAVSVFLAAEVKF